MRLLLREHVRDPYLQICSAVAALALYHLFTMPGREMPTEGREIARAPSAAGYATEVSSPPIQISRAHLRTPGEWWVDPSGSLRSDARTLGEILTKLKAGDRVHLSPGEYHVSLRVGFDLELLGDRPKEVILISDGGPVIEQTGGRLRLFGLRLQQTLGETFISRDGDVDLDQVTFQARSGGFLSFEHSHVRANSVLAMTDDAGSPAVMSLVDTSFDCRQCAFERITMRASSGRSVPLHFEDPVFRMGSVALSGRVDSTIEGATFLGAPASSSFFSVDPPRSQLLLEGDASARISNAIFDRAGLSLADRASADVRSSKFDSSTGPVIVAQGRSGLRLIDTIFASDANRAVSASPGTKIDQRK